MSVLVTGGTGTLGTPTVERLRATGYDVRVLSRRNGADHAVADLSTGVGLDQATSGVTSVLHLATGTGSDLDQTRRLVNALQRRPTPAPHLVYVSIVGVDANPMPYYRDKLACERLVAASGLGWTIIRVTQFHNLLATLFAKQRLPVLAVIDAPFQPIDVADVAPRLVELLATGPAGRVPDIGGPEQRRMPDLAATWLRATGQHKRIVTLPLPGRSMAAFKAGAQLDGMPGYGTVTFEEFLDRRG